MKKPIFLLLGGNKLNYGVLNKFQKKGYWVYVIDWNEHPQMTGDRHYRLDVKQPAPIIAALKQDGSWDQVKFAYTSIDLAVGSVAEIHRALGLQTISDAGLANSTSKSRMTACWNQAGLLNRFSQQYAEFSPEILMLNRTMPVIIKPDNSSSSRGITVIDRNAEDAELAAAFIRAKVEATNHLVIVEEFVIGQEYTVEMLGDDNGRVSVYAISRKAHTRNTDKNKIAIKLHYNCEPDELQQKIADYAIRCYQTLGFSNSLGHLEILLKSDGTLSPVEIGARSSGFIASDLVDIVSGRDYLDDWRQVMNGATVENGLSPQTNRSSMYFFYDLPAGRTIHTECFLPDFLDTSIRSRYADRSRLVRDFEVPLIDNDNARLGFEILEGPKNLMTVSHVNNAEQRMHERMFS